ncbi:MULTISPECIES: hypothetical protein [unclassified Ectothiorhodospira]|uniref:hypothetical protein n=1 Tax=unclassified Ectothiorhodospira TaxID=2684909 RepID=UPI001EE84C02|nr:MULTISPECIES: hypothetical protein [unclassified Ectothiorhodospira]MCG5517199.1 hypothetical protein [Ectothiorhodospira sp. 9100]MCG5519762.1 hypothetical protein [Ectothiorhodospira sp. 9905]
MDVGGLGKIRSYMQGEPNRFEEDEADHMDGFRWAAKAQGVSLVHQNDGLFEFLSKNYKIGVMRNMLTHLVTEEAVRVCRDKTRALECLKKKGLPTPFSRYFAPDTGFEAALNFYRDCGVDSLVVKPADARAGSGITTTIVSDQAFREAWGYAKESLTLRQSPIILEEKCKGIDVRAIVVAGRFVCAATRVPAHVIGDGVSTIARLIEKKNQDRAGNPCHRQHPIKTMPNLTEIPAKAEVRFLTELVNVHQGGEALDVTDMLSKPLRNLSVDATRSVKGLGVAGVDMIVEDLGHDKARVIELNTHCNFKIHYYPMYGLRRNPAEAVVAHMKRHARFRRYVPAGLKLALRRLL